MAFGFMERHQGNPGTKGHNPRPSQARPPREQLTGAAHVRNFARVPEIREPIRL